MAKFISNPENSWSKTSKNTIFSEQNGQIAVAISGDSFTSPLDAIVLTLIGSMSAKIR